MDHRKVFQLKSKLLALSIPSILQLLFNLFLISALIFLLLNCGGGGTPSVPTVPSGQAMETPLPVTISGSVESLPTPMGAVETFRVSVLDPAGNEVGKGETDEKGKVDVITSPILSGVYLLRASREGDPIVLEAAIPIRAGQQGIAPELLKVSPQTTVAIALGLALNSDPKEGLNRTVTFYGPLLNSLDSKLVEQALLELESLSEKNLGEFVGGANAVGEILRERRRRIDNIP